MTDTCNHEWKRAEDNAHAIMTNQLTYRCVECGVKGYAYAGGEIKPEYRPA